VTAQSCASLPRV